MFLISHIDNGYIISYMFLLPYMDSVTVWNFRNPLPWLNYIQIRSNFVLNFPKFLTFRNFGGPGRNFQNEIENPGFGVGVMNDMDYIY